MKREILMMLESEMKGNNPTILNENEYEIEEIELFDEYDDFSSESSANKFKIVEMDDCYIMCKTPNSPLTDNEKREFMAGLILYDNTKEKKSKTTHFCVLTEAEKSKLVLLIHGSEKHSNKEEFLTKIPYAEMAENGKSHSL